jgi:hypothetical protein
MPEPAALMGRPRGVDAGLRARAAAVIPGGMYGHQSAAGLPADYPQFMRGGRGARIWDADGNEYVDLMCGYGPVVLGHQHPAVEAATQAQAALGDCQNGPSPVMVDLAELLVSTVAHADWAGRRPGCGSGPGPGSAWTRPSAPPCDPPQPPGAGPASAARRPPPTGRRWVG